MNNQEINNKELASDFVTLMYQKGYRGNYTLEHPGTGHPGMTGILKACLDKFVTGYKLTGNIPAKCRLSTSPPYNDTITCNFQIQFDEVRGFLINEMHIRDARSQLNITYKIAFNQQIPGANAIEGLFPKPKPWDNILKGKFKPRR